VTRPRLSRYNKNFFDEIEEDSLQAANTIVPHIIDLARPSSVIDVGCGRGAWLSVFRRLGVPAILGVDGNYIDKTKLLIPRQCFLAMDLSQPFDLSGRHDLALCLEVAEHLPPRMAYPLVKALTRVAPIILFSAAIPGQGGTGHLNEQWPCYWRRLFAKEGFEALDPLRKHIWQNDSVAWWYRQNILVYANAEALEASDQLRRSVVGEDELLPWVYAGILYRFIGVRGLVKEFPRAVWRGIKKRMLRPLLE